MVTVQTDSREWKSCQLHILERTDAPDVGVEPELKATIEKPSRKCKPGHHPQVPGFCHLSQACIWTGQVATIRALRLPARLRAPLYPVHKVH